jgi:hypothetical protein
VATVIRFPRRPRAPDLEQSPIYWRGVEDYLTADARAKFGLPIDEARQFVRGHIRKILDEYGIVAPDGRPLNWGEGEAS